MKRNIQILLTCFMLVACFATSFAQKSGTVVRPSAPPPPPVSRPVPPPPVSRPAPPPPPQKSAPPPVVAPPQSQSQGKSAAIVKPGQPVQPQQSIPQQQSQPGKTASVVKPGQQSAPPPQQPARPLSPIEKAAVQKAAQSGVNVGKIDEKRLASASDAARQKFANDPKSRPADFTPPPESGSRRPDYVPSTIVVNNHSYSPAYSGGYWGYWDMGFFHPYYDPGYTALYLATHPTYVDTYAPQPVAYANQPVVVTDSGSPSHWFFYSVLGLVALAVGGALVYRLAFR